MKAPKVYIADAGLLHALLDIETGRDLEQHPKIGASFEGFALGGGRAGAGGAPGAVLRSGRPTRAPGWICW